MCIITLQQHQIGELKKETNDKLEQLTAQLNSSEEEKQSLKDVLNSH